MTSSLDYNFFIRKFKSGHVRIFIFNEVPLGHWKVDAGLKLRQAMLLNGILFNSEAWHNIKEDDLNILEKVDEALLRGILNSHSKSLLKPFT